MKEDFQLLDFRKIFQEEPIRKGFGRGLLKLGQTNLNVVACCADLTESTQISLFAEAFPERFFEIGVAEQNLVTVGSGLAAGGKIPFVSSYAAFSPGRNYEQIRTTICLNNRPVKIVGSHSGISVGPDGATHQMLEDIALMRVLPNMVVLAPGDSIEAEKCTLAMADDPRPNYMRLAREATPIFTTENTPFEIGKAYNIEKGSDVTIISTGSMTFQALMTIDKLYKDGIDVEIIHMPTIKPLDSETILTSLRKTKACVTVEEAQINGGLGGAISEFLGENFPVPIVRLGINDRFGESGNANELMHKFGLDAEHIRLAVHHVLSKKEKN